MAISDINRAMAAIAQPSQFDQEAWKAAFNIANQFTEAEKNRALTDNSVLTAKENADTSKNRVDYTNWNYDYQKALGNVNLATNQLALDTARQTQQSNIASTIAQNNFNAFNSQNSLLQGQGAQQLAAIEAKYRYDPTGRMRTDEEVRNLAAQNGDLSNPYAIASANQGLQKYYANMAQTLSGLNPQLASQFGVQAGLPFVINQAGQAEMLDSGQPINQKPLTLEQIRALFTPLSGAPTELTWSQKQDYQQGITQANARQANYSKELSAAIKNSMKIDEFGNLDPSGRVNGSILRTLTAELYSKYPEFRENTSKVIEAMLPYIQ